MYTQTLSGKPYHSDESKNFRYQAGARYADGGWSAGGIQHSGGYQYPDGVRYSDGSLFQDTIREPIDGRYSNCNPYQDNRQHPDENPHISHHRQPRQEVHQAPHQQVHGPRLQQVRPIPHPVYQAGRRKEIVVPIYDEDSSIDIDESELEFEKATQKKKAARQKIMTVEEIINARVEILTEKKLAEEKKLEAEQKVKEEQRLKEKEELECRHNAEKEKALADQLAAIQKIREEEEKATKAELERQAQAKLTEQEQIRKAEANGREAERKDAADRMLERLAKAEADKKEEARLADLLEREKERWCAEEKKREAEQHRAAEMERQRKQKAENMKIFILDTKKTISELEKQIASNNTTSMKAAKEKVMRNKTATRKKTAVDDKLEERKERLSRMMEELVQVSKDYNLGSELALLEEQDSSKRDTETEHLSVEVSGSLRACKDIVGQSKQAHAPKDGKRYGSSARKTRIDKSRSDCREARSKKRNKGERRKPAPSVLGWFAGESYLTM